MPRKRSSADEPAFAMIADAARRLIAEHRGRNAAARAVGIDPSLLTKLENGSVWASPDTLQRLGLAIVDTRSQESWARGRAALAKLRELNWQQARAHLRMAAALLAKRSEEDAETFALMMEHAHEELGESSGLLVRTRRSCRASRSIATVARSGRSRRAGRRARGRRRRQSAD